MLAQEIKSEILELKPIDKIHLAEFIYENLDKPDNGIEQNWLRESQARYKAYKAGKVDGVPLNEIRGKYER